MMGSIVQTSEKVTLVGAGEANKGLLVNALSIAPYLVAADGGAELVLKYGRTPKKVIGDFDSINIDTLQQIPNDRLHKITEQTTTDFDKCLRNIESPLILGVGFLGHRVDHQLAAFNSLVRHADKVCILISPHDVVFHIPENFRISLKPGTRFSLFPIGKVSGRSTGLKWPIDGLEFAPDGKIGTSNIVADHIVELKIHSPGMLAILPLATLRDVVSALT